MRVPCYQVLTSYHPLSVSEQGEIKLEKCLSSNEATKNHKTFGIFIFIYALLTVFHCLLFFTNTKSTCQNVFRP